MRHKHNDQQKMKQGMRPRNNRTLWNEQVSNIKIQTRAVACSNSLRRASLLLGLIVMVLYKPRTWCTFCPMGTMTQSICKLKNNKNK